MNSFRDRAIYRLTRHFFNSFFDVPFLHDRGPEAAVRVVIGLLAVLFAAGRLLARMYLKKYALLDMLGSAEPYRRALLADDTLALALPMLVVAFVTVLAGDSLLPDETDFRALMVLPVTERMIFSAKLMAVTLFAGLFIAGSHSAMTLFMLLISSGRWAEHNLVSRLAAYAGAGLCASTFIVLAVVALNGLLVVFLPPRRLSQGTALLRSVLLCGLIVMVPLVARIPLLESSLASGSPYVLAMPPAWFLGIERVLLGTDDGHLIRLAEIGVGAFLTATAIAFSTYVSVYKHFDRVLLRSSGGGRRPEQPWRFGRSTRSDRSDKGAFRAVLDFTRITLGRSALHQGVVAGLSACGIGLVLNSLIGNVNSSIRTSEWASAGLIEAVLWAPFALMLTTAFALRAAFQLPVEYRANWVFQMTEQDETRHDQLRVVERVLWAAIALPIAITLPVDWLVLGPRAVMCVVVAAPYGLLLVEFLLASWQRIPFTCSYLPGKRFVGQTLALGAAAFWVFGGIGTFLVRRGLERPGRTAVVMAIIAGVAMVLRRNRLSRWRQHPLLFEDQLPELLRPLDLSR
jgi:hypothetical protein